MSDDIPDFVKPLLEPRNAKAVKAALLDNVSKGSWIAYIKPSTGHLTYCPTKSATQ